MRTTVTLDPDVEQRIKSVMRERGCTFKEVLNDAIRAGLAGGHVRSKPFVQRTYSLKLRAGVDIVKALQLAGDLEDQEIVRKLELRK
jgi:hypothetical protein